MKALIEKDKIVTIYPTLPNSFKVGTTYILGGSQNLIKNNYKVENLIDFPGH